jgi:peptidoglycan L-alanyl-D-glutamate endopeptidase CwlK
MNLKRIMVETSLFLLLCFLCFPSCCQDFVHKDLITIFEHTQDCHYKVVEIYRGKNEQNALYFEGKTKLKYPQSKHNKIPAEAFDFIPEYYEHNPYDRITDFFWIAGCIMSKADKLYEEGKITHKLRWGGDWDMDSRFYDNKFNDYGHLELK